MGFAVLDCPHCGARQIAMQIRGVAVPRPELFAEGRKRFCATVAYCPACANPLALKVYNTTKRTPESIADGLRDWEKNPTGTPQQYHLSVEICVPPPADITLPENLSDKVAKALRQAEENFRREGSEEASATMYRRTIDLALKELHPDLTGDLMPRILNLVKSGAIPAAMGDWAHQVRIVGNDGAHDLDGVDRIDLEAAQGFTDALLRYLISLPKQVEERREATKKKA